ncbi:hypothetical protein [Marinobacterium arenosum]|uniref:hypothetical protein n=1 Tax=Marinobacterium arenosum TaxID=2862496 RepID=UPI001C9509BF|nr:hypothetical protein [Marinobacterium arenosum]MBY4677324.1 hypothetical protein [Marinobacterium arenosum]
MSTKPDTRDAMQALIDEVRLQVPFDLPMEVLCSGICNGCSKKLIDYLDIELCDWQQRLDSGDRPLLGDVQKLAATSRKIYRVLQRNGLVEPEPVESQRIELAQLA